jgi:hypothetical protein
MASKQGDCVRQTWFQVFYTAGHGHVIPQMPGRATQLALAPAGELLSLSPEKRVLCATMLAT